MSATPVELTIDDAIDGPNFISIQNVDNSKHAYLGNGNVSPTNYGVKLEPLEFFKVDLGPEDKIYAFGDTGCTLAIFILEK